MACSQCIWWRRAAIFFGAFAVIHMLNSHVFAAELTPLPSNPSKARVVDTTGTLTQPQLQALMQRSDALDKATGAVIIAVMVPTTGDETVDQYALRLAEAWTPGHKGDERAALLVIAKNDKKVRIETTRVMGTKLNDGAAGRIIRLMGEQALGKKAGSNFYKGIDIFYTEVAKYIPAKEEPVVDPIVAPNASVPAVEDSYAAYLFGFIGLMCAIAGIWWWYDSMKKKAERQRREEQEAWDRREAEDRKKAAEERIRRRESLDSISNSPPSNYLQSVGRIKREGNDKAGPEISVVGASAIAGTGAVLAFAARRKAEEAAAQKRIDDDKARRRRERDDGATALAAAATGYLAGRSSRDDSSSSSSRSRDDSSSSPSSSNYDSGSSSSSCDGGGASGGFD